MQVIGPLFTLFDTNSDAAARIPGFDAGVFKSLSNPNPPVRAHPVQWLLQSLATMHIASVLLFLKLRVRVWRLSADAHACQQTDMRACS